MNGRDFVLLITIIVGLTVVFSTVGVSSINSIHNADVTTTTDRDAYLGFEQTTETKDGLTTLELTVTNQQSSEATFSVIEVTLNGTSVDITDGSPLKPGNVAAYTFSSVSCGNSVSVHASGDAVNIRITRTIDC